MTRHALGFRVGFSLPSATTQRKAIPHMSRLPILDTHVHLWDTLRLDYPWLSHFDALDTPYLLPDFMLATAEHEIGEVVFVEAGVAPQRAVDEARWIGEMVHSSPAIRGIVAQANLYQGDAARATLYDLAHLPKVKGIRHNLQGEADLSAIVKQGDLIRGLQILPEFDLSFDICVKHYQLSATIALVDACPDVTFVLDHIAKPDISTHSLDPWRANIRELARRENVSCKVSGLVTEATANWKTEHLRPYVEHVITCFGWDRVCYGGDWPVCTLAGSYSDQFNALADIVAGCSQDEHDALWCLNGRRIYRLEAD